MRWGNWQLKAILLGVLAIAGMLAIRNHLTSNSDAAPIAEPGNGDDVGLPLLPDDRGAGLLAMYRSVQAADEHATLTRIDSKPAFTWETSSPHPRLPAAFRVTWTGIIELRDPGPIRFNARLQGVVRVQVDDETVLLARSEGEDARVEGSETLQRPPGEYRIQVDFRTLPAVPARVQLWWEGPTFGAEPLPAHVLQHAREEMPASLKRDEERQRGRDAVLRFGCARCHEPAFPEVEAYASGPSLADIGRRVPRDWLYPWLGDPAKVRPGAHMPALFTADRIGAAERWILAEYLGAAAPTPSAGPAGDFRLGREVFLGFGCAACHLPPDDKDAAPDPSRYPLHALAARFDVPSLAAFLQNPDTRYPDGRMPRFPLDAKQARDLATWLLMWSKPTGDAPAPADVKNDDVAEVLRRLNVTDRSAAARALLRDKGCLHCHTGIDLEPAAPRPISRPTETDVARRGCLGGTSLPRFTLDERTREVIVAYLGVAGHETHPSPFARRQEALRHAGCLRCHARDQERTPPLEAIGRKLWSPHLARMPYQRTPPLDRPTGKYTHEHLVKTLREGVSGIRPSWYSYRMPLFGDRADGLVRALAEGDGDRLQAPDAETPNVTDPMLPALGPDLVGARGYGCASCHVWNGKTPEGLDPGSVGPDLTTVAQRIRHDWFSRWLDNPARIHPGTPMPAVFKRGEPAPIATILDGKADRQKAAIWAYLALGKEAPAPTPQPPISVPLPESGEAIVAPIPITTPAGKAVESLTVLFPNRDLLLYDLGRMTVRNFYTGAEILRHSTNWRSFSLEGTPVGEEFTAESVFRVSDDKGVKKDASVNLDRFERMADGGVRLRYRLAPVPIEVEEVLTIASEPRRLVRTLRCVGLPPERTLEIRVPTFARTPQLTPSRGRITLQPAAEGATLSILGAGDRGEAEATLSLDLPPPKAAPAAKPLLNVLASTDDGPPGSLERPGYRAIAYPRLKTSTGEDRIMPVALAAHPRDGRIFVSSTKLGELFVVSDPKDDGKDARFESFGGGLFQEAYAMLADEDALFVLHRRNLTRIEVPKSGKPTRFERVAKIPHAASNAYDWGYGLVRDRDGNFVLSLAPYANRKLPGSGGSVRIRLSKGDPLFEPIDFGMRNPFGWSVGPEREIFFTDNQGEWVATNKLAHVSPGRYHGFPNPEQKEHAVKPFAKAAVWVPYGWARSLNGVTYDNTGGKFGPFTGQFFIAELMHGGAIIRADVEKVNGEYQGACFPFWGRGLIGPLVLTFDPRGRLFVGGITQPGWMGQPDRGGLFRIDYTGSVPFEIQTIRVRPRGFRLRLTAPVDAARARDAAAYLIEHYRYEYTGSYGSPELDRTRVVPERIDVQEGGLEVDLKLPTLVKDRCYAITAAGVRSATGTPLVHPTGVYTLNEIPK